MCKREVILRKHTNTRHILNHEKVNIVIENDSNAKKLKRTKLQIYELEDKVEHQALGKARLECGVGKLMTENTLLTGLFSLCKDSNLLFFKQTAKKKKTKLAVLW